MLTSELDDGEHITEFCSTGPKSYSYVTTSGKAVCKVKGFTLSRHAAKVINFKSMLDMVYEPESSLNIHYPFNIRRDKRKMELQVVSLEKRFRLTYDKRIVLHDYTTVPYGYCETSSH